MGLFLFNIFGVVINAFALIVNAGSNPTMMVVNTFCLGVCIFCTLTSAKYI